MIRPDLTIQNVFDALQKEFGPFRDNALSIGGSFEDIPATMLDGEFAGDMGLAALSQTVRKATAQSTAARAP